MRNATQLHIGGSKAGAQAPEASHRTQESLLLGPHALHHPLLLLHGKLPFMLQLSLQVVFVRLQALPPV